jgi:hypothetical protein
MNNARDIRDAVVRHGLGGEVTDAPSLAAFLLGVLRDAAEAERVRVASRQFLERSRGAADKVVLALRVVGALGREGTP